MGIFQKKRRSTGKRPWRTGERWPKYSYCFFTLRSGVVLDLLIWSVGRAVLGVEKVDSGFQDLKQPKCLQNKGKHTKTRIGLVTGICGEKKADKHKEFWWHTPWFVSRLSRGHVPSVPSSVQSVPRILPLEFEFPHKSAQTSRVSLGRPRVYPRDAPGVFPPPNSFM